MFGSYEDKFSQARAAMLMIATYPGKQMHFMGTEYAQFREWDFENSLEWFMLDYPMHRDLRDYTAALNRFYLKTKELWELDFSEDGFSWISPDDADKNMVAYKRFSKSREYIVAVINFSGEEQSLSFSSSKELFSIFDTGTPPSLTMDNEKITLTIPAFSGAILKERNTKIYKSGGTDVL